jgi:hypothetical protein
MPQWKWSGPTRVRRAKLASSEARGEPMPITLPFATVSCRYCWATAAEVGSVKTPVGQISTRLPRIRFPGRRLRAAEVNRVLDAEHVQIVSAGIFAIEPHAAVALDATVHLVIQERAEVLIAKRALLEFGCGDSRGRSSPSCPGVAFAAYVAHRAVVRMIQHHAFDDAGAERDRFRIVNGNPRLLLGRRHARHDDFALAVLFVLLVLELFDGALAARAHRSQSGCQQKYGRSNPSERQAVQQVLLRVRIW